MTEEKKTTCMACPDPDCCYWVTMMTLLDIHILAQFLEVEVKEVIEQHLAPGPGIFIIRKKRDASCRFLGEDKMCSIYPARPQVCRRYQCTSRDPDNAPLRLPVEGEVGGVSVSDEHEISVALTKTYYANHGPRYSKPDFDSVLDEIRKTIRERCTSLSH